MRKNNTHEMYPLMLYIKVTKKLSEKIILANYDQNAKIENTEIVRETKYSIH